MKNIVKHNAGKNLLAQSSESTGSVPTKSTSLQKIIPNMIELFAR